MEIAALPSCEKSLFAGAKVAFFFRFRGSQSNSFFGNFAMESAMYKIHTKIHV